MDKKKKTEKTQESLLQVGTVLRGIYRIDRYLSSGGFGNTYVGYNTQFDERIAIKEFFMRGVTARDDNHTSVSVSNMDSHDSFMEQKRKFCKEAKLLRKLNNPHIVGVHDLFEENGTAYYVMDFIDGESLGERMKRTDKALTEEEVWQILPQVLDALQTVHKAEIWHLDLKPGNIMIDKDGTAKLIDFGAAKQLNPQKGGATTNTSSTSYTCGYAPREQMEQNYEKFGPWTDIYALGATLYSLLTNHNPPLPSDLDDDDTPDKHEALPLPPEISQKMRSLILWMMQTKRTERPQSIDEVLGSLGSTKSAASSSVMQKASPEYEEEPKSNSWKYVLAVCLATVMLGLTGLMIWKTAQPAKDSNTTEVAKNIDVTLAIVVVKSADNMDYYVLGKEEGKGYKVVKQVQNYTPSDGQPNITVSSDQQMNRLNKVDEVINTLTSAYSAAKIVFLAQQNLKVDPAIKAMDAKLTNIKYGITYFNPGDYSSNSVAMVEEYANENY